MQRKTPLFQDNSTIPNQSQANKGMQRQTCNSCCIFSVFLKKKFRFTIDMYIFELPFPVSVNAYYRKVASRVILSKRGRTYTKEVALMMQHHGLIGVNLSEPLTVRLELYRGDKRSLWDSDNYFKSVFDALTKCDFITDDSIIVECSARKMKFDGVGRVVVKVDYDMENGFE